MISVRSATVQDSAGIAAAHVASWQFFYRDLLPAELIEARNDDVRRKQWDSSLRSPDRITLVACEGDAIVGFASVLLLEPHDHGFAAYLQTLYFTPEAAGRGTGRRLLSATASALIARNVQNLVLRVLRLNPARGFYEHLGARLLPEGIATDAGLFDDVVYAFDDLRVLARA